MGLGLSPAKMLVARVVTHRDLERELILALERFARFEFIDVTQQAKLVDVKRSRDEETVFVAFDRINKIMDSLGLEPTRGLGKRIAVDDSKLAGSLEFISEVIRSVEPEVLELDSETAAAQLELEKQLAIRDVALSLEPLGLDPTALGATDYTFTTAGVVPRGRVGHLEWSIKEVTEDAYVMKHLPVKRGVAVATLSVPVERKEAVERILSAMEFEAFKMPETAGGHPEEIARAAGARISELEAELEKHASSRKSIVREWSARILAAWEILELERLRVEAKALLVFT
ncbi:MAG: hypothetical protein ACFFAY_13035, partial [Promethearchaeota archaeon]